MSQLLSRSVIALISLTALCAACGSDQKSANSADDVPPAQRPGLGEASSEPPTSLNGEPTHTPPDAPPPSSANASLRSSATPGNAVAMPEPSSQPAPAPLSEGQIAKITELANSGEIEQGKLAQTKAKSPKVRAFATKMVKHHSEAKNEQAKLFKQLNLTPTQSTNATVLKDDADNTLGTLRGTDAASFDSAYMDAQVAEHEKVLDTIDHDLLPAASEQPLIDGLNKMRETVLSHLTEARQLQAELNAQKPPSSPTR